MRPDYNRFRDALGLWCAILAAACLAWLLWDCHRAQGQVAADGVEDVLLAHELAKHGELECNSGARICLNDLAGIYYAVARRFGDEWPQGLRDYTRLYERKHERARYIRRLPWGDYAEWGSRRNAMWSRYRRHALDIVRGDISDPCPGSWGWGGVMDTPSPRLVLMRCRRPTANRFYRLAEGGGRS